MNETSKAPRPRVAPWSRVAILIGALAGGCGISYKITGSIVPITPADSLIFQSTLLVVVLGSAILEHKFTRPADSVVNALMGVVTLVTVYQVAPKWPWWCVFIYCASVFVVATVCVIVST